MKYKRVLPIETCVVIQSNVFQDAINEIFGEADWLVPNWRYEEEDDYLAQNGIHKLTPEHIDYDELMADCIKLPKWDWSDFVYIPSMILANMICDGYVPEGADHYYIDCSY